MKGIWICTALLLASMAMTGTGITLLVLRYQAEAPPEYHDASINYRPRLSELDTQVIVAKDDQEVMRKRVVSFVQRHNGTVASQYSTRVRGEVPLGAAEHIHRLHSKHYRLSPGYKDWPGPSTPEMKQGPRVKVKVDFRKAPYRKLMLDLGASTTAAGAVLTFINAVILTAVIMENVSNAKKQAEGETEAAGNEDSDEDPEATVDEYLDQNEEGTQDGNDDTD